MGARESEDLPPVRAPTGARGSACLVGWADSEGASYRPASPPRANPRTCARRSDCGSTDGGGAVPRLLLWRRPVDAALVLMRVALVAGLGRSYRPRGAGLWLSPLADVAVAARLTASVLRPERTWRGRSYPATRTGRR